MRNTVFATIATLAMLSPAVAQERVIPSNPMTFPEPAPGFRQGHQIAAGPWRVWIDARAIDPRMHVVTFEKRIYRTRDAAEPELLLETKARGGDTELWLSHSGQVLIKSYNQIVLYPVGGDPFELSTLSDDNRRTRPVFFDDDIIIAVRRHSSVRSLVEILQFNLVGDAQPIVLDNAPYPRAPPYNFVCSGRRVVWLRPSTEQFYPPTVRLAVEDEPAREVPLTGLVNPTLDGLFGDWLVMHDKDLVRLLDLETGRELQLLLPGRVEMVHPRGILWRGHTFSRTSDTSRLVWWNLATNERHHLLVPGLGKYERPGYQLGADNLVIASWGGILSVRLDDQPMSLDKDVLAAAAQRLGKLRQAWTEQSDHVGRALSDLRWPLGTEAPELLAEIAVTCNDPNVAASAASILGISNDPAVRRIVLDLLQQVDHLFVWERVVKALTRIGHAEDAESILACDPVPGRIEEVADALGILGNSKSVPWLESKRDLRFPTSSQAKDTQAAVERALRLLADRSDALDVLAQLRD